MANKSLTTLNDESYGMEEKCHVELKIVYGKIKITNVLYSPTITRNMLLVGYLVYDGRAILSTKPHVYILDNAKNLKIIAISQRFKK